MTSSMGSSTYWSRWSPFSRKGFWPATSTKEKSSVRNLLSFFALGFLRNIVFMVIRFPKKYARDQVHILWAFEGFSTSSRSPLRRPSCRSVFNPITKQRSEWFWEFPWRRAAASLSRTVYCESNFRSSSSVNCVMSRHRINARRWYAMPLSSFGCTCGGINCLSRIVSNCATGESHCLWNLSFSGFTQCHGPWNN